MSVRPRPPWSGDPQVRPTIDRVDDPALTYSSYLALDEVLGAQRPRSGEHDELLFIVIHQVYELWFKQIMHELGRAQALLEAGHTPRVMHTLKRVLTILKVAVSQVDVLETMTPTQFSHFRDRLDAASGFQSAQFRDIESVLGIRVDRSRSGPVGERAAGADTRPSLWDSYARYLISQGYDVPASTSDRDVTRPLQPDVDMQEVLLKVYADDGAAAQVTERLVDLDEGLQEWRYRHLKMVERTIGDKPGTGGSSGVGYLRTTLTPAVFPDLWAVRRRL